MSKRAGPQRLGFVAWLVAGVTDVRKGFDTLSALVQSKLG